MIYYVVVTIAMFVVISETIFAVKLMLVTVRVFLGVVMGGFW